MISSYGAASTTVAMEEVDAVKDGRLASVEVAEVTTPVEVDTEEEVDEPEASPRARALADVQLERLRILVVEDDLCEHSPLRQPTATAHCNSPPQQPTTTARTLESANS